MEPFIAECMEVACFRASADTAFLLTCNHGVRVQWRGSNSGLG